MSSCVPVLTAPSMDGATLAPPMERFYPVARDAATAMMQRNELMARSPEFFRDLFGGRIPTLEEKLFWIEEAIIRMTSLQIFSNDIYMVEMASASPFIRLSIRRHDGQPCNDWSHLQQIKNELVGREFEAVELFPAESRLIDTCNQYHLWVHADPGYRFPFGFQTHRFTSEGSSAASRREPNAPRPQAPPLNHAA